MAEMMYVASDQKVFNETVTVSSSFDNDGMKLTIRNDKLEPIGHIILDKQEVASILMLDFDPRN